jgi:hypothetical protein
MTSLSFDEELILNYRVLEREYEGGDSDSDEGSSVLPEIPKATDENTDKPTPTHPLIALDRLATKQILAIAINDMDDLTLKNAVHSLLSSYRPNLLETIVKHPSHLNAVAEANDAAVKEAPKNEIVQEEDEEDKEEDEEEPEMRTATDENIRRLMKKERIGWEAAWMELRCKELEDGDSICCTEECSDRSSAEDDLVEAARRGKEKRNARRRASGRQVSEDETYEDKDSSKKPYIAPPKVRDAEFNWPFMRCKNVANAYKKSMGSSCWNDKIPRNHHGLLEYIATKKKISVETLKKTNPRELFKDNFYVINALGKSYRW